MRRWLLIGSLACNLVLAGVGAAALVRRGQAAEAAASAEARTREARRAHLRSLEPAPGGLAFLGDSLTERAEWTELLGEPRAQNRGVAGDTVADARARATDVLSSKPSRVFVMLGTNDLAAGTDVARIAETYADLLDALAPTAVVVQSVPPVQESDRARGLTNARVRDLNVSLRALAEERKLVFVDVHAALVDASGQLDPRFTSDGVHLDAEGYLAWRRALAEALGP